MHDLVTIIDDDPISILVCETIIKKCGFAKKTVSFGSGIEGLAYFKELHSEGQMTPTFIFLDIQMPEMDGWAFLKAYENLPGLNKKKQNVVMLSAAFNPSDYVKAEENALVLTFLSKPISAAVLADLDSKLK